MVPDTATGSAPVSPTGQARSADTGITETEIPASSSGRTPGFGPGNPRSNRGAGAKKKAVRQQRESRPKFDRNAYQAAYMRDLPFAKAEGLTIKQWRVKHGK